MCDYQGNLLLVSSYGDRNTNIGTDTLLLRALFDITNVDASGILGNGVRSALLGIAGTTDVVSGNAAALEVNANAAQITLSKVVNKIIAVPSYTTFIPDSVKLNNVPQPGYNPQNGINISTLAKTIGVATVTFQVIVSDTIPSYEIIPNTSMASYQFVSDPSLPSLSNLVSSNIVNTLVVEPTTSIDKYVDKAFSSINETLNYTIAIRNTSTNVSITNMILYDTIPTGTTFVTNSITKDGTPRPGEIVEPPTGFNIGSLNPNMATTIKFSVTVDNTIPSPNPILNNSTIIYNSTFGNNSNEVSTQVNSANLGSITKYTDKVYADCGDVITYTIAIPNIGNTTALNIVLKDTIPNGTIFITDSVLVNNSIQIGANPTIGITIPNIAPNLTATVTFSVRVQC